jgi:translation initiation factor 4G
MGVMPEGRKIHPQVENPKAEDVECLCKLLTTIGAQLDASPKGYEKMGAYFYRLERLATSPKLESRHRFMIQVAFFDG